MAEADSLRAIDSDLVSVEARLRVAQRSLTALGRDALQLDHDIRHGSARRLQLLEQLVDTPESGVAAQDVKGIG